MKKLISLVLFIAIGIATVGSYVNAEVNTYKYLNNTIIEKLDKKIDSIKGNKTRSLILLIGKVDKIIKSEKNETKKAIYSELNTYLKLKKKSFEVKVVDETADWKIYKNTRYNYSIKYPSNWYVNTANSESDFTQRGAIEDKEFIGGDTYFSNYSNIESFNMDNTPKDLFSISLMINKVQKSISIDDFIMTNWGERSKEYSKEYIKINGVDAVRLLGNTGNDHPSNHEFIVTYIKIDDKIYGFNYGGPAPISNEIKNNANRVISSFKLIENSNAQESKYLGNGFSLIQTNDNTNIVYNEKTIYTFSHKSDKIPFIWDEGCDILTEKLKKVGNNGTGDWKQEIWNGMTKEEQKKCIKDNYYNKVSVTSEAGYFLINVKKYSLVSKILFDSESNKTVFLEISADQIIKIEKGLSGIYIIWKSNLGNVGGVLYINNDSVQKILFRNTDLETNQDGYVDIYDFELLTGKRISIKYKGKNLELMEKIISIQ